ncbi:hypothetical protein OAM75_05455 [Gammaproteobacteria bacterium]|jgi:hypothetical protein|nr:hypothetical protein [Pseudomonadales bacterium]MDC0414389.1 hypothetical protein [Gammaproteobacteria bacterium]
MTEPKTKTMDGAPTPISSLNLRSPELLKNPGKGVLGRVATCYQRLNEVMSGMYTGVGCTGTPHAHHSYNSEDEQQNEKSSK